MKTVKVLLVCFLALMGATSVSGKIKLFKKKQPTNLYIVGVAASFSDSLLYFTDVQILDSVKLDKNHFLPNRIGYSTQLKDYLEQQEGLQHRTCFVMFDTNRKKLDKKVFKMKRKYQKESKMFVQQVNPNEFSFAAIKDEY